MDSGIVNGRLTIRRPTQRAHLRYARLASTAKYGGVNRIHIRVGVLIWAIICLLAVVLLIDGLVVLTAPSLVAFIMSRCRWISIGSRYGELTRRSRAGMLLRESDKTEDLMTAKAVIKQGKERMAILWRTVPL